MTRTTNLEDLVLVITFPTLPRVWNVLWNDALGNPSAASAVSAMTWAIGAGSAYGVRGRASCKRQVIDSDPGGSQQARLAFFLVA
jgi:hypothetical protein